jgi:hypothetical protein
MEMIFGRVAWRKCELLFHRNIVEDIGCNMVELIRFIQELSSQLMYCQVQIEEPFIRNHCEQILALLLITIQVRLWGMERDRIPR